MSFPMISFTHQPYDSKFGSKGLQQKFILNADEPVKKDEFNGKYKKQKKITSVIQGIILTAVGCFAAYKGRGGIKKLLSPIGKAIKSGAGKIASKLPNLAAPFTKLGSWAKGLFKKATP